MMENCDGIIFDVDGTLWDSTDVCAIGYNRAIERLLGPDYPKCTADQLKTLFGKTTTQIGAGLFPDRSEQEHYDFTMQCIADSAVVLREMPPKPYPQLEGVLKKLYGKIDMFIVSNCESGYIEGFLESSGFGKYFRDFVCLGDTGYVKKDNIREIIRRNNLKNSVYVGDVQGDSDSAHGAGIPMIYAAYGFGKVTDAEYTIEQLKDLPAVFGIE